MHISFCFFLLLSYEHTSADTHKIGPIMHDNSDRGASAGMEWID